MQVFSCEICEIFKNIYFDRPPGVERQGASAPRKFADNVPFFSKSPLNVRFLKIFNLKWQIFSSIKDALGRIGD